MITQKELKEILRYDKESGDFIWLKSQSKRVKTGTKAGHLKNRGYIAIKIYGKIYRAHRLAWLYVFGEFPKHQIDHINHVRNDNRICNLRECTNKENSKNKKISKLSPFKIFGVGIDKRNGRWKSKIIVNSKEISLYYGDDFFEACCARKSAERKYGFHENHGS